MSNYYDVGMNVANTNILPERVRQLVAGVGDFHRGSRRFYDAEIVGAASGTWVGTLADGVIAIALDAIHVLLLVGGSVMMWRVIFP